MDFLFNNFSNIAGVNISLANLWGISTSEIIAWRDSGKILVEMNQVAHHVLSLLEKKDGYRSLSDEQKIASVTQSNSYRKLFWTWQMLGDEVITDEAFAALSTFTAICERNREYTKESSEEI